MRKPELAPSFRDALARAAGRLAQLRADPVTGSRLAKGPELQAPCPVCNGRGFTEKPMEGHARPRQLCPACGGEGTYCTPAGLAVLELIASVLEPIPRQTTDSIREHNEADAARHNVDLARRRDRVRRETAARELQRQAKLTAEALLRGEELPEAGGLGTLAGAVLGRLEGADDETAAALEARARGEEPPEPPAAKPPRVPPVEQRPTAWGFAYEPGKGASVFRGPAGPESDWPAEARELHERWKQQQRQA